MRIINQVINWAVRKVEQDRAHAKPLREALEFLASPIVALANLPVGYRRKEITIQGVNCEIVYHPKQIQVQENLKYQLRDGISPLWIIHVHGGGYVLGGMSTAFVMSSSILDALSKRADIAPIILSINY